MKILIDHSLPFFLAHGGLQTQIEQTKLALEKLGCDVEWVRWWDDTQRGDLVHFFGRPSHGYIEYAHAKGLKVIIAELLTGLGSRGALARRIQAVVVRMLGHSFFFDRMGWLSYRMADASVALTSWEGQLMHDVFGAPADRVHVVPNGVEDAFLQAPDLAPRGPWLVCTATIAARKRVLELARGAVVARTPTWIIGRPYAEGDAYSEEFRALARQSPEFVRYEGAVSDRAQLAGIYREARGFVLLSTMESLSLSALEAAACGCPLLLSDLPWARSSFGDHARYCPVTLDPARIAPALRAFYEEAPQRPPAPRPLGWPEVARQLAGIYEDLGRRPIAARTSP